MSENPVDLTAAGTDVALFIALRSAVVNRATAIVITEDQHRTLLSWRDCGSIDQDNDVDRARFYGVPVIVRLPEAPAPDSAPAPGE